MTWTQSGNIRGASGIPGASGASGPQGASGVPGATGPAGPTGATGASGGTGGTGGPGITRSVSTITTNSTTLSVASNTDYVVFANVATTPEVPGTGDQSYPSTVALLHCNGSNDATSPITDNSALAADWTTYDGAKLSTSVKKFGTASIVFDGINDYVQKASSPGWGTSAYTVEMWIYPTAVTGDNRFFYQEGGLRLAILSSGQLFAATSSGSTTGASISANTWSHVAISRSGTSARLFLNGTQTGSTFTDNVNHGTVTRTLGQWPGLGGFYQGYIDEVRLTSTARYTTNFTAPTDAFPDSGTAPIPAVPPEVTVPTAISSTSLYTIKNINASNSLTVKTTSSQTIDGQSTATISVGSTARYISDGSNWRTV